MKKRRTSKGKGRRTAVWLGLAVLLAAAGFVLMRPATDSVYRQMYPRKYSHYIEQYSSCLLYTSVNQKILSEIDDHRTQFVFKENVKMFEQLSGAQERYQAINDRLMDPNVVSDPKQYAELMKEYKNLTPIVEKYCEYKKATEDMEEAKMMLEEGGLDKDFRELIEEQYETSKKDIEVISEQLKILLIPKDPNDDKNVIVEIRGGAGGDEAALFANSLYRMYSMYAESQGWKIEVLNANPTELGGYKEISFSINGDGAYSKFKFESGVHRVQRVPETETQGRIHTSTVTVAVLPEVDDVEVEINPKDLQIDTYRSGGAGGQHVNKTESAIRITHLPTGTVVELSLIHI